MCICICMTVWKRESCHFWCFSKYPGLPVNGNVLEGRDIAFFFKHSTPHANRDSYYGGESKTIFFCYQKFLSNIFILSQRSCVIVLITSDSSASRSDFFQDRSSGGMLPHQHKSNNALKYNGAGRYQFPRQQL